MAEPQVRRVEYGGKTYTLEVPEGTSDAQVLAAVVQRSMADQASRQYEDAVRAEDANANNVAPEIIPRDMTFGEAAKLGLTDFAARFIPDVFIYSPEDIKTMYAKSQGEGLTYAEVRALEEQRVREMAGVPPEAEQDLATSIVRGLSDPTSIAGPLRSAGLAAKTGFSALGNLALAVPPTAAGVITGEVTRQVLPEGTPLWVEDLISSVTSGFASVPGSMISTAPLKAAGNLYGDVKSGSSVLPELVAKTNLDAKIESIKQSGNIDVQLQAMRDIEADTGVKLPPIALAKDNPIVGEMIKNISSADPTFRAKVEAETANMLKQLEEGLAKSGVKLEEADTAAVRSTINRYSQRRKEAIEEKYYKQLEALEEKRVKLSVKFDDTDAAAQGRAIENLAKATEETARKAVSNLYTVAIREATARGTAVPADIVKQVYEQTRLLRPEDVFVDEPAVAKKLQTLWAPKEDTTPSLVTAAGVPFRTGKQESFDSVPVKELDSLKRAVNDKLRRTPRDSIQYTRIRGMKKIVEDAVEAMRTVDEGFVEQYRAADEAYYNNISIPTKAAGMASINRAQFEASTADRLVGSAQQAREFINFVGAAEGLPIVRHAMRLKARKEIFTDGVVDRNKLRVFLNKPNNIELIKAAGMEKEFNAVNTNLKTIEEAGRKHKERFAQEMKDVTDGFFKAVFDVNLNAAVRQMLDSPGKRERYISQINRLPKREKEMAMKGIEQGFKELALASNKSAIRFIDENAKALSEIYGKEYIDGVRKMSTIVDIIRGISENVSTGLGRIQNTDLLEQRFGITVGELSGTLRNQILSTQRKAINLFTKSVDRKAAGARDRLASEFLLDREAVSRLSQESDGLMRMYKKGKLALKDVGRRYAEAFSEILPYSLWRFYFGQEAVAKAAALERAAEERDAKERELAIP